MANSINPYEHDRLLTPAQKRVMFQVHSGLLVKRRQGQYPKSQQFAVCYPDGSAMYITSRVTIEKLIELNYLEYNPSIGAYVRRLTGSPQSNETKEIDQ